MNVYRLLNGKIIHGDALEMLKKLPERSVQCCVTSPPYWGLRDYGVKGQFGQESSPEEYVENLVAVFREVKRVLCDDGTLWLNLGDSYNGSGGPGSQWDSKNTKGKKSGAFKKFENPNKGFAGLKPKDLVGIPWRVAFALQADGWYLRSDIIWHKSNAMPESVTDRPTKSHEYIFLFSKNKKYFYDADAIREPHKAVSLQRMKYGWQGNQPPSNRKASVTELRPCNMCHPKGKNKRTVWTIAKGAYRGKHFATFPREIPEMCIKAGSRLGDVVLDPFAGSGTTLKVAVQLGRVPIGIELNKRYINRLILSDYKQS